MAVRLSVFAFAVVCVANLHEIDGAGGFPWDTAYNLGLSAFQKSEAGAALSQTLASMKDMPESIYNNMQQQMSNLDSATNAFLGDCDGPGLVNIIKPKLNLKKMPKSKCLKGLRFVISEDSSHESKFDKDVTMFPGTLITDVGEMTIEGSSRGEEESGTSQTLFVSFKYSNLKFSHKFESVPKNRLFGRSRKGMALFKLVGPNSVTLRVRVPKELDEVTRQASKDTCFVRIRDVYLELGKKVELADLWYDSGLQNNFNWGLTDSAFRRLVTIPFIRDGIIESIKTSLKKALEPVISDQTVFCDSKNLARAEVPKCAPDQIADLRTTTALKV